MTLVELGAFAAIVVLPIAIAVTLVYLRMQWKIRRCPHHPHRSRVEPGVIRSQLIDTGTRKMFWCLCCSWYRIV